MTDKTTPLLEVKHLKQYFPINRSFSVKAVDDISFYINRGETYGLVGESGSGKSTTGRSVIRLYNPTAGEITFDGHDIGGKMTAKEKQFLKTKMQMIFQDPMACLNPREKVMDIIAEGLDVHHLYSSQQERAEKVYRIMERVGLSREQANRYPHQFSGGQRQRIGIARALVMEPELIIADEAISALDVSIQAQILNLLKDLQEKKKLTYVFVSHDMSVISHISDRVLVMYLGQAVELAEKEDLFEHPLHPYTQALMQAVPIPDPREQDQCKVLEGEIPSPMDLPSGCPFCARCKKALAICKEIRPQMAETADGHQVACHLYTDGGKQ